MDIHSDKHQKISVALAFSGFALMIITVIITITGVVYLWNKIGQSENQSAIDQAKVVEFDIEKTKGL